MSKFNDKYRIESTRIKKYDYSQDGYYYLTICSKDRKFIFSKIVNEIVILNTLGKIVEDELKKSCEIRKEIFLEEYVIMPNHIHLIIRIQKNEEGKTTRRSSLQLIEQNNMFEINKKSVSSFVMGFKQAVTQNYRAKIDDPNYGVWQPRFFEHIIRSEKSLYNIRNYILNNPLNWNVDEYNTQL